MINTYDKAVLRHHAYPSKGSGVTPGSAAFIASRDFLTKSGYISDGRITERGAKLLGYTPSPIPRARLVGLAALVVAALAMLAVLALALYGAQQVLQAVVA
jgi:hypothetical protein